MPTDFEGEQHTDYTSLLTKPVADIRYVNQTGDTLYGDINMNDHKISNLATPTNDKDAVNLKYVSNVILSLGETIQTLSDKTQRLQDSIDVSEAMINTIKTENEKNKIEVFCCSGILPSSGHEVSLSSLNHVKVIFAINFKLKDNNNQYRSLEDAEVKRLLGTCQVFTRFHQDYANEVVFKSINDFSTLLSAGYTGRYVFSYLYYIQPDSCFL